MRPVNNPIFLVSPEMLVASLNDLKLRIFDRHFSFFDKKKGCLDYLAGHISAELN